MTEKIEKTCAYCGSPNAKPTIYKIYVCDRCKEEKLGLSLTEKVIQTNIAQSERE